MVGTGGKRMYVPPDRRWRNFLDESRSWAGRPLTDGSRVVLPRAEEPSAMRRRRRGPRLTTRGYALTASGQGAKSAGGGPGGVSRLPVLVESDDEEGGKAEEAEEELVAVPDGEPVFLCQVTNSLKDGCQVAIAFGTRAQIYAAPYYHWNYGRDWPGADGGAAGDGSDASSPDEGDDDDAAAAAAAKGASCPLDKEAWDAREREVRKRVKELSSTGMPAGTVVSLDYEGDDELCCAAEFHTPAAVRSDIPRHARFRTVRVQAGMCLVWRGFRISVEDLDQTGEGAAAATAGAAADAEEKVKTKATPLAGSAGRLYAVSITRDTMTKSAAKK